MLYMYKVDVFKNTSLDMYDIQRGFHSITHHGLLLLCMWLVWLQALILNKKTGKEINNGTVKVYFRLNVNQRNTNKRQTLTKDVCCYYCIDQLRIPRVFVGEKQASQVNAHITCRHTHSWIVHTDHFMSGVGGSPASVTLTVSTGTLETVTGKRHSSL